MEEQQMPPAAPQAPLADDQDIQENKLWAFVGYLGIFSLLPLFIKKDSKFAQFHAKQGVVFFVISYFLYIFNMGGLNFLISIILALVWWIAIFKVWQGKYWKIPVIGDVAEKIKI